MATNLSSDPVLIERVLEVSGERTRKAAVTLALEIARCRQRGLLDLMDKLEWDPAVDVRRKRERPSQPAQASRRRR